MAGRPAGADGLSGGGGRAASRQITIPPHVYPLPRLSLARPALFAMDAETAHEVTLSGLQRAYECGATRKLLHAQPQAPTTLMGMRLANPIGLAAGLDKNGAYIDALGNLGFGFIEVGTVTRARSPATPSRACSACRAPMR